jgi:hypothetical protein
MQGHILSAGGDSLSTYRGSYIDRLAHRSKEIILQSMKLLDLQTWLIVLGPLYTRSHG